MSTPRRPNGPTLAPKFAERLAEDEGLTSGLGDEEAQLLLTAVRSRLARELPGKSDVDAERSYAAIAARARRLARIVAALCYDGEADEAERLWRESGGHGSLAESLSADAVEAMKRLLTMEGMDA